MRIFFADQHPDAGEPLRLSAEKKKDFDGFVEIHELDSFVRDGERVVEGEEGGRRVLEVFQVQMSNGRITSAAYRDGKSRRDRARPRGEFHGWWGDLWLEQESGAAELKGRFWALAAEVEGTVQGERLELSWKTEAQTGGMALERDADGKSLRGHWWKQEQEPDEARERGEQALHLFRVGAGGPAEGLEIPVHFAGLESLGLILWVPIEELNQEWTQSIEPGKTRRGPLEVSLELGLWCYEGERPDPAEAPSYYAEYPIYDTFLEQDFASQQLYFRAWLVGAELVHEHLEKKSETLLDWGRRLAPDAEAPLETEQFHEIWQEGKRDGAENKQALYESLVTRFAAGGLLPGDVNPFTEGSFPWLEFKKYRSLNKELCYADLWVEVCERYPDVGDPNWGRVAALGRGVHEVHKAMNLTRGRYEALRVPSGFEVTLWTSEGDKETVKGGTLCQLTHMSAPFHTKLDKLEVRYDEKVQADMEAEDGMEPAAFASHALALKALREKHHTLEAALVKLDQRCEAEAARLEALARPDWGPQANLDDQLHSLWAGMKRFPWRRWNREAPDNDSTFTLMSVAHHNLERRLPRQARAQGLERLEAARQAH